MIAESLKDPDEEVSDGDDDPELLVRILLHLFYFHKLNNYI